MFSAHLAVTAHCRDMRVSPGLFLKLLWTVVSSSDPSNQNDHAFSIRALAASAGYRLVIVPWANSPTVHFLQVGVKSLLDLSAFFKNVFI